MNFDNFDIFYKIFKDEIDYYKINIDVAKQIYDFNYSNLQLSIIENRGILADANNNVDYIIEKEHKQGFPSVYIQSDINKLKHDFNWARFGSKASSNIIFNKIFVEGEDLFIEYYYDSTCKHDYILKVYKEAAKYLLDDIGQMNFKKFDNLPKTLSDLKILPDAELCVNFEENSFIEKYIVSSYIGQNKVDEETYTANNKGNKYMHSAIYTQTKYNEFIKPLLNAPKRERQFQLTKKI